MEFIIKLHLIIINKYLCHIFGIAYLLSMALGELLVSLAAVKRWMLLLQIPGQRLCHE